MHIIELKYYVKHGTDSHFFDRETMEFFGDTLDNYCVSEKPVKVKTSRGDIVECWELRRIRPVKHGLQDSAYFNVKDFSRVLPAKD